MYADGPSGAVYVTDGLVATMRACFGIHGRASNQCVQRVRAMSKQDAGTHLLRRTTHPHESEADARASARDHPRSQRLDD